MEVYSEFRRPGPGGEIVEADRGGTPREILSPAVARNAYATFFVVLKAPPDKKVTLYVGSNPEGLITSTLYEALDEANGIPDRLRKCELPVFQFLENGAGVYLLDLFVPPSTPVRRVRYELQFNVDDRWIIQPMELRVQAALVPDLNLAAGSVAPLSAPAGSSAFRLLASYLCAREEPPAERGLTIRALIRRNASQDVALARKVEIKQGHEKLVEGILKPIGFSSADAWCATHSQPDPEAYPRVRDILYRIAVN